MIEWIPKEEPLFKKCRHCEDRITEYIELWNVFFRGQGGYRRENGL